MSATKILALQTRLLGISFRRTTTQLNPVLTVTETSFNVNNISIQDIVMSILGVGLGVEYLGSFVARKQVTPPNPPPQKDDDPVEFPTQFALVITNFGCADVDLSGGIKLLQGMPWKDNLGPTQATVQLYGAELSSAMLLTFLEFRKQLPSCDYLLKKTLLALNSENGTVYVPMSTALTSLGATSQGDTTMSDGGDEEADKWAKELFRRLTIGGPNGSMAGKIAVNFMKDFPTPQATHSFKKRLDDNTWALIQKVMGQVLQAAAIAAAEAFADYLKGSNEGPSSADNQVATVVKGIRDSMPNTGKTVAQLAVFKALQSKEFKEIPVNLQLRAAYSIANSTRATVESVGNQVAALVTNGSLPKEEDLAAVDSNLLAFLKSVGETVVTGVKQAAPVVWSAISASLNANNALMSHLPPTLAASETPITEMDPATQIILASRIVNGTPNPQSTVVTDKAVSDLAERQSNLGGQATAETYSSLGQNPTTDQKNMFLDVALGVAAVSPTFSNVTDIGASNLVTDTSLKHADALRQHTLEMGIRSCANIITEHSMAELLYKVHLHRVKTGVENHQRDLLSFLKSAVPIATDIAKVAAPALLALL